MYEMGKDEQKNIWRNTRKEKENITKK